MTKRILAIDGGGVRGIIPACILAKIESMFSCSANDLFDLIVGTSTGGIIGLLIRNQIASKDIYEIYCNNGGNIFNNPKNIISYVYGAKYKNDGLKKILYDNLADTLFRDIKNKIIVTSYNIKERCPVLFRNWGKDISACDLRAVDIALATSAAPTYFPPFEIDSSNTAIDGGVFCNNPSLIAYAEARKIWEDEKIDILSISTGSLLKRPLTKTHKKWGKVSWGTHVFEYIFDGASKSADKILRDISRYETNVSYKRVDCSIRDEAEKLDGVSNTAVDLLRGCAEDLWTNERESIFEFIDQPATPAVPCIGSHGDQMLDGNSKYLRMSIFNIMKELLEPRVNLANIDYVAEYTITDLIHECTKVRTDGSKEYIKKTERKIFRARAEAFGMKYGDGAADEKLIAPDKIQLKNLRPWTDYLNEIFQQYSINLSGLSLLDVGIGPGTANVDLYSQCKSLMLTDISEKTLKSARSIYPKAASIVCSAENLEGIAYAAFDVYASFRTYQSSLFDITRALREARRVLNGNGFFIISVPIMFVKEDGSVRHGLLRHGDKDPSDEYACEVVNRIASTAKRLQFKNVTCSTDISPFEHYIIGYK